MVTHSGSPRTARAARRLSEARPAAVAVEDRAPVSVDRVRVAIVREEWHVVERWWTEQPIRRRYFDIVLETGENAVVFLDELGGGWFRQRA
jgi:hypothetical protein